MTVDPRKKLVDLVMESDSSKFDSLTKNAEKVEGHVRRVVHEAYRNWGYSVLGALSDCLNYNLYGMDHASDAGLEVHFYNAQELANKTIENARLLLKNAQSEDHENTQHILVSMDDMIDVSHVNGANFSFSRLFSIKGDKKLGYVARPGTRNLQEQLGDLKNALESWNQNSGGRKSSIVLLEDNIRHANMVNWCLDTLHDVGIFKHAKLAGISTAFCCASENKKMDIRHEGKPVPLVTVVDCEHPLVDVSTPRDLLFDGMVVEVDGKTSRLPIIFMDDMEGLFKIRPEKAHEFKGRAIAAAIAFCDHLERELGVNPPLGWFNGAEAIAHVTQTDANTAMKDILKTLQHHHDMKQKPSHQSTQSFTPVFPKPILAT